MFCMLFTIFCLGIFDECQLLFEFNNLYFVFIQILIFIITVHDVNIFEN
jgi:hypothetical protein